MVLPKNFDNPDEAFALAKIWAKRRERKLLGIDRVVREQETNKEQDTENDDD